MYVATKGQSPYIVLVDDDIWGFSIDSEIILLGDFNARTGNTQEVFYDTS